MHFQRNIFSTSTQQNWEKRYSIQTDKSKIGAFQAAQEQVPRYSGAMKIPATRQEAAKDRKNVHSEYD